MGNKINKDPQNMNYSINDRELEPLSYDRELEPLSKVSEVSKSKKPIFYNSKKWIFVSFFIFTLFALAVMTGLVGYFASINPKIVYISIPSNGTCPTPPTPPLPPSPEPSPTPPSPPSPEPIKSLQVIEFYPGHYNIANNLTEVICLPDTNCTIKLQYIPPIGSQLYKNASLLSQNNTVFFEIRKCIVGLPIGVRANINTMGNSTSGSMNMEITTNEKHAFKVSIISEVTLNLVHNAVVNQTNAECQNKTVTICENKTCHDHIVLICTNVTKPVNIRTVEILNQITVMGSLLVFPHTKTDSDVEIFDQVQNADQFKPLIAHRKMEQQIEFNHQLRNVEDYSITSATIEIDESTKQLMDATVNSNIRSLTILADTVIVRVPIRLASTNLIIRCRKLVFDDGDKQFGYSQISLTPSDFSVRGNPDGLPGLSGASLSIQANTIEETKKSNTTAVRFVVKGGNGQAANDGRSGGNGRSVDVFRSCIPPGYGTIYPQAGEVYSRVEYCEHHGGFSSDKWFTMECGSQVTPSNGEDGANSGQPQLGGTGGTVNLEIADKSRDWTTIFDVSGGDSGLPGNPGNGGAAGTPGCVIFTHRKIGCNWNLVETTYSLCVHGGANGLQLKAPSPQGPSGSIKITPNVTDYAWVHSAITQHWVTRSTELYLANQIDNAKELIYNSLDIIIKALSQSDINKMETKERLQLETQRRQLLDMKFKIDRKLDIFGNMKDWSPNLNMETYFNLMTSEVGSSVDIMYLCYLFNTRWNDAVKNQDVMNQLRSINLQKIKTSISRYHQAQALMLQLETTMFELNRDRIVFAKEIQDKQKRFQEYAEKNAEEMAKKPGMMKAFEILKIATKIIPVPGIELAGDALEMVTHVQKLIDTDWKNDPSSGIDDIDWIAHHWSNMSISIHMRNTTDFLKQLEHDLEKLGTGDWKEKIKTMQGMTKPFMDIIGNVQSALSDYRVPDGLVQQLYSKMVAASPDFKILTARLQEINERATQADNLMTQTTTVMTEYLTEIHTATIAIDNTNSALVEYENLLQPVLHSYINNIKTKSEARLLQLKYYVKKAYEYRMLRPFPGDMTANRVIDQLLTFLQKTEKPGGKLSQEEFNTVMSVYRNELRDIVAEVITVKSYSPGDMATVTQLTIDDKSLDEFNQNGKISVDTTKWLAHDEENQRIVGVKIVADFIGNNSRDDCVTITLVHPGVHYFIKDNKLYRFRMTTGSISDQQIDDSYAELPRIYRFKYFVNTGEYFPEHISYFDTSLLKTLTKDKTFMSRSDPGKEISDKEFLENLLYFSRASLLTKGMEVTLHKPSHIQVKNLSLRMFYDYTPVTGTKRMTRNLIELDTEIQCGKDTIDSQAYYTFTVRDKSNTYVNSAIRVVSSESIIIEADQFIPGGYVFDHFEIYNGKETWIRQESKINFVASSHLRIIGKYSCK